MSNYFESFKLAWTMSLLIGYIFMAVKSKFDRTITNNKLSFIPYYLIFAMLTVITIGLFASAFELYINSSAW